MAVGDLYPYGLDTFLATHKTFKFSTESPVTTGAHLQYHTRRRLTRSI